MTEIWTNNTWANWLKDNGVKENECALIEVVGYNPERGKKVLAVANTSEELHSKIPKNKKW